jgi:hypothetical protein
VFGDRVTAPEYDFHYAIWRYRYMMQNRRGVRCEVNACLLATLIIGLCAIVPHTGSAQTPTGDTSLTRAARCIDTVSSAPEQRIAYLRAAIQDSADEHLSQSADLFAQSVAQSLRSMLGIKGDTLPAADPTISWRNIQSGVSIVISATRSGGIVVQPLAADVDPVAGGLLTRIARAVQASGDWFFWPPDEQRDSVSFELSIVLAPPHQATLSGNVGYSFAVFSIAYPTETSAVLTSTTVPPHPDKSFGVTGDGTVMLDFIVDSTGHVDTATIRDPLLDTQEYPTGKEGEIYKDFVKALREWLPTATYEPARIGGCPVRQLVQQPFAFTVQ